MPNLNQRPLVLATHLVPSLPIGLFEVLAEIFEVVTKKPVVLLHETRINRQVAKDIVDIGIPLKRKANPISILNNVIFITKRLRRRLHFCNLFDFFSYIFSLNIL
jgi:hypothetical protein